MVCSGPQHTDFIETVFTILWCTRKCDVIYSRIYDLPCVTGHETHKYLTEEVGRPMSYTEFVPSWTLNVETKDTNSFPTLSDVWFSVHRFCTYLAVTQYVCVDICCSLCKSDLKM